MAAPFSVGLTRDFLNAEGKLTFPDIGLGLLDAEPGVRHRFMDPHPSEVPADHLKEFDAIISMAPKYTRQTFTGAGRLVSIARFGVGYEMVDVPACTEADVLLLITKGAVDHTMAESIVTFMLALCHRLPEKDRLAREGRWDIRGNYMGSELRDRTLGVVGLGGIGSRLLDLVRPFGMTDIIAFDPFLPAERAATLGVRLVPLNPLMRESDIVSISCPLNEKTRNLIGREQLALMKPTAYLINTARGGIVDEAALIETLRDRRIAGAGLDVLAEEPAPADHPLAALDNVILTPHCLGWTRELFRDLGRMACSQTLAVSRGEIPDGVVNPEVLDRPGFRKKLDRLRNR